MCNKPKKWNIAAMVLRLMSADQLEWPEENHRFDVHPLEEQRTEEQKEHLRTATSKLIRYFGRLGFLQAGYCSEVFYLTSQAHFPDDPDADP
jgi:hypothetical protein